ncbi:methylmalonyl Co-A mutase-associated GTPase MeaB [Telmatospirillum sp.]|uniref:methylmalonyl Co-A mutase-associated GTPase MeaB n=1 Tax=Telmatospirillum sp. TaxID=2079197 RepID=UPI00283C7924|nr:methylmalonyl Co-A mutase-associated GTPase MeaB [Telmatospirillum sp.]MDR3439095.1 methylmalonyl Co-A mutase-associated GTPase MeaB [Telmatospirillum sp.]
MTLATLRSEGKGALARALTRIEKAPDDTDVIDVLSEAYRAPQAHVAGMTGPPGVGKSTLINGLIKGWRARGKTVACIAVDPSSRRSGGALLGDRIRLATDPEDQGVFIRSMAARDRLGGLASMTVQAMVLMRALFDVVLIETVGVGQSETDVIGVADTVILCVQPGSGDSLQFMKAGIAEIPHIVAVTKADMGATAERARADVVGAMGLSEVAGGWQVPVLLLSALQQHGVDDLIVAIEAHADYLKDGGHLVGARRGQAAQWLIESVRERFGREGVRRAGYLGLEGEDSPFRRLSEVSRRLSSP